MGCLFGPEEELGKKLHPEDLSESQLNLLIHLYEQEQVYMDRLPYSTEIERIAAGYTAKTKRKIRAVDVHNILVEIRKNSKTGDKVKGLIPRRKSAEKPDWIDSQLGFLRYLYSTVQHRIALDELPYTEEFEAIYAEFLMGTGIAATRREFFLALLAFRKGSEGGPIGIVRSNPRDGGGGFHVLPINPEVPA